MPRRSFLTGAAALTVAAVLGGDKPVRMPEKAEVDKWEESILKAVGDIKEGEIEVLAEFVNKKREKCRLVASKIVVMGRPAVTEVVVFCRREDGTTYATPDLTEAYMLLHETVPTKSK